MSSSGRAYHLGLLADARHLRSLGSVDVHSAPLVERRLLVVVAEVLQNQIRAGVVAPDVVRVVEQDVHAALVVLVPRTHVGPRVHLRQAFAQVDAVAVDVEFLDPKIEHPLPELPRPRIAVIKVVARAEGMLGDFVEPRVVAGS